MCAGRERADRLQESWWKVAGSGGLPPIRGHIPTATVSMPGMTKPNVAAHGCEKKYTNMSANSFFIFLTWKVLTIWVSVTKFISSSFL